MEHGGVGAHPEPPPQGLADGRDGLTVGPGPLGDPVVHLLRPVEVHHETEALVWPELIERFAQKEPVGAEVDPAALIDEPPDDLGYLRMEEGFPPGDGDHRGAGDLGGVQGLIHRHPEVHHIPVLPDPAAADAAEVASLKRLEHEDDGEELSPLGPLPAWEEISREFKLHRERPSHLTPPFPKGKTGAPRRRSAPRVPRGAPPRGGPPPPYIS